MNIEEHARLERVVRVFKTLVKRVDIESEVIFLEAWILNTYDCGTTMKKIIY